MAHNIENINGNSSFVSMHLDAWHRLGHTVTDLTTWREICDKFMSWEIDKIELKNPITGDLTGFFGLCRDDNGEMLHIVKKGYEVIQNSSLFEFIDSLIGTEQIAYETAGVLGKGEKVFVTAKTGEFDLMASGDIHKTYLLGTTSHDGSLAETYKLTETRVVCNNTLTAALSENGKELKFRHTKNAANRKDEALKILRASHSAANNLQEKFEILAQRKVSSEIVGQTIAKLFKIDLTKDLSTKQSRQILTIKDLFESNDNDAFKQFRGTGYNLLNAATEYVDHYRDTRGENGETDKQRAYSALFGSGDKFKQEAMEIVLELTNGAQMVNQPVSYSIPDPAAGYDSLLDEILSQK
jgi:phage/plasmid-like protein (TIGR03299 family)